MGWLYVHKDKGISIKDFFRKEFGVENVVDVASNLHEAYIAYREDDNITVIVCLIDFQKGYYNFGYKSIHESCHPYYYKCPQRILEILTNTTNERALNWRKECWRRIRYAKAAKRYEKAIFSLQLCK